MKMGLRWPQRRQQNGVTLRPPIKGRIPPINGSTPVALYQWNLLERQKAGIPLIKGIATQELTLSALFGISTPRLIFDGSESFRAPYALV